MKKILSVFLIIVALTLVSGCSTSVEPETNGDTSLSDVQAKGKLIVGSNVPYEPMELFDENGEIVGIDIDIIKEVGKRMGVEVEVINYGWDELFTAVKNNEIDVAISSITITEERKKEYLFSSPYFNAGQVILVSKNTKLESMNDLVDKQVGAQIDTTNMEEALKLTKPENVVGYENHLEDAKGDLLDGTLDAIVIDYVTAMAFVQSESQFKILGEPFTEDFYGIMSNLENVELMSEIDGVLRDMRREDK